VWEKCIGSYVVSLTSLKPEINPNITAAWRQFLGNDREISKYTTSVVYWGQSTKQLFNNNKTRLRLFCFIIVKKLCWLTLIYHRRIDTQQDAYYKRNIQQPLLSNVFTNKHVYTAKIVNSKAGTVFSVRFLPRCYKQDSWLIVDSWSNELVVRLLPAGKNMSTEAENLLGCHKATTGEDIANCEDFICAVVTLIFGVCNSVRMSWLFVVMFWSVH
jgi:hypothetical protein